MEEALVFMIHKAQSLALAGEITFRKLETMTQTVIWSEDAPAQAAPISNSIHIRQHQSQ